MKISLKKLNEQVMVITGATSGIGLCTARMAAERGAKLVLAARSVEALTTLVDEIRGRGSEAIYVIADVGHESDVRHVAEEARRVFGGFDTWVNNAGASIYGSALEISLNDMHRLFATNFWGVVYGSRVACEVLRDRGGALINIGSETSDKAVPLQVAYSASKHAVKGWTDGLRMELEHDGAPVSVTLIKPAAIDTPYPEHAKNYLEDEPTHVPPVYTPESVAEAILYAATTPVRDLFVGSGAKGVAAMNHLAPGLTDSLVEKLVMPGTHSGKPRHGREALYQAGGELRERGEYDGLVRNSLYTRMRTHPAVASAAAVAAGLIVASLWRNAA